MNNFFVVVFAIIINLIFAIGVPCAVAKVLKKNVKDVFIVLILSMVANILIGFFIGFLIAVIQNM